MKTTIIPPGHWPWLIDAHRVDTKDARVIVLHGNEDCPDMIEVFGENHYQASPMRVYHPQAYPQYTVMVGNIGQAYRGGDLMAAYDAFREYRDQSKRGFGRAAGEEVTMFRGDEIVRVHRVKQTAEAA